MTAKGKSTKGSDSDKATEALTSQIRSVLEAAGVSAGVAEVWRKLPGEEKAYLDRIGIDELAVDVLGTIKSRWGGGKYHVVLRDEANTYVKGGSLTFTIAGPPVVHGPPTDEVSKRFAEIEKRWEERAGKAGDASSVELMRFMFENVREQLREIRNPPAAAVQTNPLELTVGLMKVIQEANAPLVAELMKRSRDDKPRSRTEELRELLELVTLVQRLGGQKPTGMDAVVEKLADPLGKFFERAAPTSQGPPGGPMLPPGTAGPTAGGPAPDGRPAWFPLLERALPSLVKWAHEEKDPELRADVVIEDLPDRFLAPIHEQLKRGPAFVSEFLEHVPDARAHRDWFGAFFARILEDLESMWIEDGGTQPGASAPASSGAPTIELHASDVDEGERPE